LLFLNRGDGIFVEKPDAFRFKTAPQGSFTGMAAADFDRDGRLDLYLCCYIYFQSEDQYQYPAPYEDARDGPPNFLFRNRGAAEGPMFEDVTAETGMNENNDRFSFAPSWCDFDGDGWPDLYVANDFGRANFYRNRNGKFRDEGKQAGLDGAGPGMSASWFDYDGDGRPDLYVSDMWTAAGQRVVADPAFRPAARDREAFRRHTKGNSLYRNRGDGTFEETSAQEAVEMGRWAWSSGGFDWDLDGAPEIFVATGMVTNGAAADPDLNSFFWRQVVAKTPARPRAAAEYENGWNALNQLIREDYSWNGHEPNVFYTKAHSPGGVSYVDASGVSGLDFADDTRTFAVTDFDGDGVPDLILKNRLGPQIRAIQNDCGAGRPSIAISLRGIKSNRDAIGARVEVNGQVQWLSAGSGFLSQHSKRLYFGLAGRETADVKISWPSGATHEATALEPHYAYTFVEGSSERSRTPFRRREAFPVSNLAGKNEPEFRDAWLLEPAPTPDSRSPNGTAGFVVFHGAERPMLPSELPIARVDLTAEKPDVAACYSLFRRYLFEYRADLSLPLTLLVDEKGRACKIYSRIPSAAEMKSDLGRITDGPALALPFPGKYYLKPRRNLFKAGAAFYWAGYPERALPYLAETLRARPDNWKALLAIARIQLELGRDKDALASFRQVIALKTDYPPAFVGAGESYARVGEADNARGMFEKAMALDPKCADAMNQLGLLSASANDLSAARGWFKKALAAEPDHPGAINNLGVLYAKLGQPNDSIAAFRYGIQTNPDDDELYLNLARIYVTMSEREKARAVLNQLLEHKPGNSVATKALAELEAR
jgi:tetratricopeptide (TPR) repeat protein